MSHLIACDATSQLTGAEYQSLRFFISYCRQSLIAINGAGPPTLLEVLPWAIDKPLVMKSLLSLAARLRRTSRHPGTSDIPEIDLINMHQNAIEELRSNVTNTTQLTSILISALVLCFQGFSECNEIWATHLHATVSMIDAMDRHVLETLQNARLVQSCAAHLDIAAFTIGKVHRSTNAWLRWGLCPIDAKGRPIHPRVHHRFTSIEVTSGYPESLLTIIALISKRVDDSLEPSLATDNEATTRGDVDATEDLIRSWQPPPIPTCIPLDVSLTVTAAWELFRKAALIYHWRGKGFCSDFTTGFTQERDAIVSLYVREIVFGIRGFLVLGQTQNITIGNAMLWPLVVASCEVAHDKDMKAAILEILHGLKEQFRLAQIDHLLRILRLFWDRVVAADGGSGCSLEAVARGAALCVPIY